MDRRVILKKRSTPATAGQELIVTCPGGAEEVLADELREVGFADVRAETGAVRARRTGEAGIPEANRLLRTASRVLMPVAAGPADDYDAAYAVVRSAPWDTLLPLDRTFAISATARSAEIRDHRFLAMRAKDAIVDRQRERLQGKRSSVERQSPDVPVVVFAGDGRVEVSLDTSGAPLHERGYRTEHGEAPLRETVAAMMLRAAGWPRQRLLVDPFCGAGTIAIEAALIAGGRVPGDLGRRYAYQRWSWIGGVGAGAGDGGAGAADRTAGASAGIRIVAADVDPAMVATARRNAERAGVADWIEFSVSDGAATLEAVGGLRTPGAGDTRRGGGGVVVTNPPYGERLAPADLDAVYGRVGGAMKQALPGWEVWMILGEAAPARRLGLAPDRRLPVFNGGLAAQVCHYQIRERTRR